MKELIDEFVFNLKAVYSFLEAVKNRVKTYLLANGTIRIFFETREQRGFVVIVKGINNLIGKAHKSVDRIDRIAKLFSQAKYTKTYTLPSPNTVQGNFTDSDNYFGDWNMKGAAALQEIFQQIGGTGYGYRDYTIVTLTANTLDVYYVQNNAKVEEVYYAY